jgi:hypothetical protein
MAILDSTNNMETGLRRVWRYAGAPADGAAGTLYGRADIGDLLIDTTNKKLYQNRNTKASPTWTEIAGGASGVAIDTVVGNMAAAGTAAANTIGAGPLAAPVDHVHAIGTHDHSDATKGDALAIAALGADFFTADATGRAVFQTDIMDATTVADLFATDSFTNAILDDVVVDDAIDNAFCDAKFAAEAFAADADSRSIFADGIWTNAKLAVGILSADATGRALFADDFFDATTVLATFEDNSIPGSKVDWSYGTTPGNITPDDAAAAGTGTSVARIDHVHGFSCAAPSGGLAAADAEGAAVTMARSNHVHKAILADNVSFLFGTGGDVALLLSDANAHVGSGEEDFVIGLSDDSQCLHITDLAAIATDWNLTADTHPTIYVHSNTTPATDYILIGAHDGTDGFMESVGGNLVLKTAGVESVSFEAAVTHFNAGSADVNFLIESNGVANMFAIDGGIDTLGIGAAASAAAFVYIAQPVRTLASATEYASVHIEPAAAVTTFADASTYDFLASLYIAEPNLTNGGGDTITIASTVYIKDAPDEGAANYALYVASGATGLQALTAAGLITASGGIAMADQKLDFTTGYIEFGTTPADAGEIRQENDVAIWASRNQADGGNILGWKVNAADDYEAGADVNLAGNLLYGGTAANADLDLNATINGTVATAYIIARQTMDCTVGMVATMVKAGAIGDAEGAQTDIDGEIGIDSSNGRLYFRYGAGWHYCTQDAGFAFPEYERTCPVCGNEIAVGDSVVGVINEIQEDGARHGLYCHASCVGSQTKNINLPNQVAYPYPKGNVNPSARDKMLAGNNRSIVK